MAKKPRVVAATGVATSTATTTAAEIESAMTAAAELAREEGITNPAIIRERMLEARTRAKAKKE